MITLHRLRFLDLLAVTRNLATTKGVLGLATDGCRPDLIRLWGTLL